MAETSPADRARHLAVGQAATSAAEQAVVDQLNQQAWEAQSVDPRLAITLASEALTTAEAAGYRHGAARSTF